VRLLLCRSALGSAEGVPTIHSETWVVLPNHPRQLTTALLTLCLLCLLCCAC
jgi:hypothetical protein